MTLNARLAAIGDLDHRRCPAQRLLDALPTEERTAVESALADQRIATLTVHQALRAEGYRIGRPTLQDHRVGRCYCSGDLT